MVFRTTSKQVGMACLDTGVRLIHALIENTSFDLSAEVKNIKVQVDAYALGPSTAHIVQAAYERRIPIMRLNDGNLVQLGHSAKQQRIWTAETSKSSAIAEGIASDKPLCNKILEECGIPVPRNEICTCAEDAWDIAQNLGLPVVVKPSDANHGRGVSLELDTQEDIQHAWQIAQSEGSEVMIEQFIRGVEHRILVVNYKVVAVARGELIYVTGNGTNTLQELIDLQINIDPRRGEEEEYPLEHINAERNETVKLEVKRQGYTASSIVQEGKTVLVQRNSNASTDVTDLIHPDIARICELAARVIGLDIAGIDFVCEHIDHPLKGQSASVIEVNAGPGLLMHLKPTQGTPRNIGEPVIDSLFPEDDNGRIPLITFSGGTELQGFGETLAELLEAHGQKIGAATCNGLRMGGSQISKKSATNWQANRNCLINKHLETAVFEVTPQMILSEGLAFDRSSIAVITSLGQLTGLDEWDILTTDQLFNVMRTTIDLVLKHGFAIINADEVSLLPLQSLCDGQLIWTTQNLDNPIVNTHIDNGGRAVVLDSNTIQCVHKISDVITRAIVKLPEECPNKSMLIAVVATAWAIGVPHALIQASLSLCSNAFQQNI